METFENQRAAGITCPFLVQVDRYLGATVAGRDYL